VSFRRLSGRSTATVSALILIGCSLPLSADADWQYTRWGMTLEEVVAASGGAAQPHAKDPKKNTSKVDTLATAPYEAAGFIFRARFLFSRGEPKLARVDLEAPPAQAAGRSLVRRGRTSRS